MEQDALSQQDGSSGVLQYSGDSGLESGLGSAENTKLDVGVDDFTVDWEGPDDAANPINWPARRRWANIMMISILGFITYVFPPHLLIDTTSPRLMKHVLTAVVAAMQESGPYHVRSRNWRDCCRLQHHI